MKLPIYSFLLIVVMPMWAILWTAPPETLRVVAGEAGTGLGLVVLALAAPGLLRRLFARRARRPVARAVAGLDWPASLTRAEMEAFCLAWLRSHSWSAGYTTEAEVVYLAATRGGVTLTVLCDVAGEELNPATLRAFAQASERLRATHPVLLTLLRAALPHPATAAARAAGVMLLRVAELPRLDALASAGTQAEPEPAAAG